MRRTSERRARIVCTIGPASESRAVIRALVRGGMDVARLNFSHGDHASHRRAMAVVREEARRAGRAVAVLQDLQGIKIRTGPMSGGSIRLRKGAEILVSPGNKTGTSNRIYVSYPRLVDSAKKGDRILLDDGLIALRVTGREGRALRARVVEAGVLSDRKGVNLPGMSIQGPSFTAKDRRDLALGLSLGVDYVAVSFVRGASDVMAAKRLIRASGGPVPVIAKIEKPEAVSSIDEILEAADGIMVARGDLGVEMSAEDVPIIQKMLINKANAAGKLVITATQMLESMTEHTRPTRAEAADVANAVIDGSDALMLSAETSTGRHPGLALGMMDRIIRKTESGFGAVSGYTNSGSYSEAIALAAADAARDTRSKLIIAFTHSGYTARLLSKFRPPVPILAYTPFEDVRRRMSLYWGVRPRIMRPLCSTDDVFGEVESALFKERIARPGDSVVITASAPIGGEGKTNLLKLHRLGEKKKPKATKR